MCSQHVICILLYICKRFIVILNFGTIQCAHTSIQIATNHFLSWSWRQSQMQSTELNEKSSWVVSRWEDLEGDVAYFKVLFWHSGERVKKATKTWISIASNLRYEPETSQLYGCWWQVTKKHKCQVVFNENVFIHSFLKTENTHRQAWYHMKHFSCKVREVDKSN